MHTREQPQAVIRKFLLRMEQFIRRHDLIRPGASVVLGISGGMDSMAMLDAFCLMQKKWRLRLAVAHVNYGLRGKASDGDERSVIRAAKKYGVPVFVKKAETRQEARTRKVSIQAAAREIRYAFFRDLMSELGAEKIAVAHNAGDNAETMIFNFFRGSGIEGLKGISVSSREVIRPLQFAERAEIAAYMKARTLRHREDASNTGEDYSRNFIRRSVIPSIEKRINPSLIRTLNAESAIFASCADFIGTVVNHSESECILQTPQGCSLSVKHFMRQHVFLQQMLVKRALLLLGIEPDFVHIEEIIRLLGREPGRTIECGNGYRARRTAASVDIGKSRSFVPFALRVHEGEKVGTEEFTLGLRACRLPKKFRRTPCVEYVDAALLSLPLTIRPWQPGDWFMPLGMKAKKKLSDFFTDLKIAREEKSHIPVVLNGKDIIWVAGLRLDDRFKVTSQTHSVYQLSIQFHDTIDSHLQQ